MHNKESLGPGFTRECYQTFEELTAIPHNLFKKIKVEGTLFNLFYEASISLISKLDRQYKQRKLWTNIPHEYNPKLFNKVLPNRIFVYIKRITHHD